MQGWGGRTSLNCSSETLWLHGSAIGLFGPSVSKGTSPMGHCRRSEALERAGMRITGGSVAAPSP